MTDPSANLLKLEGDTIDWGWNIGFLYELNENNRFGLSYRSEVELKFDGDFTDYIGAFLDSKQPGTVPGKLNVVTPAIAEIGGFHQLNNQWAVHYGVQWIQWSKFEELRATSEQCKNNECLLKEEDFDDNFRYSIGATYNLNPDWTLRAGFAFDEQAGKSTLSIPDTDRYWYSAGFTYNYSSQMTFDFGFTYLYGKSNSFKESGETFHAENDAYLTSAQINYIF